MALQPDHGSSFWIPLLGRCVEEYTFRTGFAIDRSNKRTHELRARIGIGDVTAEDFPISRLLELGSKERRVLLCQPPVETAAVIMRCAPVFGGDTLRLTTDTGITIGDIADAIQRLRSEHVEYCRTSNSRYICTGPMSFPVLMNVGVQDGYPIVKVCEAYLQRCAAIRAKRDHVKELKDDISAYKLYGRKGTYG